MSFPAGSTWIWVAEGEEVDQYAEFCDSFLAPLGAHAAICLSADSDCTLYINGAYVASGQYADFPHYKIYDTIDITSCLRAGENHLRILVHYYGTSNMHYRPAAAGLLYTITVEGQPAVHSRAGLPARLSPTYEGRRVCVSSQLGFTFFYDATKEREDGFHPAVAVEKECRLFPRPIPRPQLLEKRAMRQVVCIEPSHYLVDLGGEVVGPPTLALFSEKEQTITVAWGEHIADGCVRKTIGDRHFFFTYRAKAEENRFTNYMLRLGCRYIEVMGEEPFSLHYAGVLPQVYPTKVQPVQITDPVERHIYEACVHTLQLCMMEHYVDCPWREQALYAFDSRNQMLCGYMAFSDQNAAYARANLKLIGQDDRADGLLSICYPTGNALAIPSFSLHYILAMWEYIDHTGDSSLAAELLPKLFAIIDAFLSHRRDGLVCRFAGPFMWNFYDWSLYASGNLGGKEDDGADVLLNCLAIIALDRLADICRVLGHLFPYTGVAEELRGRTRAAFLAPNGLFTMRCGKEEYTQLGNAMAILSTLVTGQEAVRLCDRLMRECVPCSLSMKVFVYEALLRTDAARYGHTVREEIRNTYLPMLEAGSDTVWETALGEADFDRAGSLCHGWSAVPVYFYHRLGIARPATTA